MAQDSHQRILRRIATMQIKQIHGNTATIDGSSSFVTVHCTICLHNDEPALLVSGTSQMIHTDIVITNPFRTAPLVFSGCGSGSFQLHELTLSDLVVAERMSLLGNSLSSLSLSNTVFRNVSNFEASPTILEDASMQTTQVLDCKLNSVENGLYGTIFRNINGAGTFLGMNMSILNNDATYDHLYLNKADQNFASSKTLESVYFENCTSTTHGGGLLFTGAGAFALLTSKFVNCRGTTTGGCHGGGFSYFTGFSTGPASLTVSNCIIIGCYSAHVGGGLQVGWFNQTNQPVTTTLNDVTIEESEAARSFGGLLLQFLSETTVNNVQIKRCRATNYNSIGVEGTKGVHKLTSFKVISTQGSTAHIVGSRLVQFNPVWNDVFLNPPNGKDILKYPLPTISELFIERGYSPNELPSLCFVDQWNPHFQAAGFTPSTLFTADSFTTANQPAVFANEEQSGWMKTPQINMNSEEGVEDFFCWVPNSKCKSLSDVIPRTGSLFDGSISMDDGTFEEHDLNIGGRRLVIAGTTQEGTILKDSGSTTALMTVTTGQLTLSALTLSPSGSKPLISSGGSVIISYISISPLSTSSASLIAATGGSVTASHFEVASIDFSAGHVFSIANADLVLSNCRFSSIMGASDGYVISSTGSGKVSLDTVSFSCSSCDDANAGSVIHITRPSFEEDQIVLEGVTIASPSSTNKYQVFISCPSAAGHMKASWSSFVPSVPTTPVLLRNEFWCEDSSDSSKSSCMAYYVYPFASGAVHVSDGCEDHALCGSVSAPCVSISAGMNQMKETKIVTLDSSMNISSVFESTASEWTLTQSSAHDFLWLTKDGQLKISSDSGSKLTLLSLHIVAKEVAADRTSPLIDVGSGSLRFSSCSCGGGSGRTIPLTLCSIEGGSVSFEGDTTIVNPSLSHHLFRVVSGELSVNSSLTINRSLSPRSVSLIDMKGGTTTIEDSIDWIVSSPPPLTVGGTASLVLDSVVTVFRRDLPTIVDQNGGSVTMISCSFSNGSLTGSFIASCGSMKIVDTQFTKLCAKSSSNGNQKRALTLTVNENECVVIGDENKAVGFVDCSSDGDGGAMHCRVNVGGELRLLNVSFSKCSSSGAGGGLAVIISENVAGSSMTIRAMFSSCSCGSGAKGDWIHLTGWSFEDLIVLSNWEVSQSSLSSPSDDSLLFGVDMAEEPSSSYKDITLLYYLIGYRAATIFVGSEGRDAAGCGQYVWRCRSVEQGVSQLEGHVTLKLG
ncbi:hypothetical protein BLNAU_13299 [Blattamonas nauphoetae]|uniref:Right handed beta helix domain-containing protein n=1 Tax=Blattamonas nauphoetae TaxID=2049346 RepID=A0ABQ9XNH5_9EUKA|nr:hypothetical protein BLNAU_13299 [Blattamonas nauphoetae]